MSARLPRLARQAKKDLDLPPAGRSVSLGRFNEKQMPSPAMFVRFLVAVVLPLLLVGCQHGPPWESGQFRQAELVEVVKLDPTIQLDIRYATTNNFLHRPVYAQARAFLQRPAAEALG